jgi:hypothetical protein
MIRMKITVQVLQDTHILQKSVSYLHSLQDRCLLAIGEKQITSEKFTQKGICGCGTVLGSHIKFLS